MKKIRFVSFILCLLLLLPAVLSCGQSAEPTPAPTVSASQGSGSATSEQTPAPATTTPAQSVTPTPEPTSVLPTPTPVTPTPTVTPVTPTPTQTPATPTPSETQTPAETFTPPPEEWWNQSEYSFPMNTSCYALPEAENMTDIELARYAAAEGMVLLKNEGDALPLQSGASVALFGSGQIDFVKGGTGSGDVNALYTVNLLEGMRGKAANGKIVLNEDIAARYEKNKRFSLTDAIVKEAAEKSDIAVVVISRTSGENIDLTADQFVLSAAEQTLLRRVCGGDFKHIILVLNVGAVMSTAALDKFPQVDAVLICWQPGLEGGNATADVLCGDINPSGKLVDTIAKTYADYPSSKNFAGSEYAVYTEDIFVGYRYFETFDPDYSKVLYPFGYGLSYTTFELSEPHIREVSDSIVVQVLVKNTGKTAGKEVVQVYYSYPQGKLGAPGKALAAFAKTKLLQPGEWQAICIAFDISDMAMYDDTGKVAQYAYVLEAGEYNVYVGNSIKDAGQRGAAFTHTESADRIVLQLDDKISPTTLDKRLNADGSYETLDDTGYTIKLSGGTTVISAIDYLAYYENILQKIVGHITANSSGTVGGIKVSGNKDIYYNVYAPADGAYKLCFGYGMEGGATTVNALTVTIGSDKYSFDLTGTGGLYNRKSTAEVEITLKKGGNMIHLHTPANLSFTFVLIDLTFDRMEGSSRIDYTEKYQPQSLNIASGKKIDFLEVYEDPTLLSDFVESLTPAQMLYMLIGHSANVGKGDGSIAGLKDLNVPCVDLSDGPAGLDLAIKQVAWPIETALACTWDTSLLYAVGEKVGDECYAAGVNIILGPGVNIHRDPLGGRNFEYYSEDPLITGKMAAAFTLGVQKKGTAGVMIKHFYANNREAGRVNGMSSLSERAARMIYMKAFEICVKEAQPLSIMTTYNLANGIFNAENKALLDGVVRGEWGFEGFICTDWGSMSENAKEIAAGNDVKMMFDFTESNLAAYRCGYLTLEQLRACATRILTVALHSGSMERTLHPTVYVHEINGTTRIKAAEMTERSPEINFEECLDEDGGINPNYCQSNRYLLYEIDVKKAGTYSFVFRIATEYSGTTVRIEIDGKTVTALKVDEATGGWQIWRTEKVKKKIELTEGTHYIKFVFGDAVNINWFELAEQ